MARILDNNLGTELLILVVVMAVSMALIPIMIRLAPRLGMIDNPDPRKVHSEPIPRVGGVGIVIGALVPLVIWLPFNEIVVSYLFGALILFVFGIWDDIRELGHYVKFIGQFMAVLLVVYYGDLYVDHLPFIGDDLSEPAGKLFTVIAMVGVINALNHSDGLDGLAGGESLMTLGAIAYLAYRADDALVIMVAFASIGGVFGFLRFNSHPARVFMGDGGSQFLGFTLAFLAVYLTQISNRALSPALPALLLGLPIVDILAVFAQRMYKRMNWFRASKNHIHHRLLELGFHHYESVMLIYSVQALLVLVGVLIPYESDVLILAVYASVCSALFTYLWIAEQRGWKIRDGKSAARVSVVEKIMSPQSSALLVNGKIIEWALSVFMLSAAVLAVDVPLDLGWAAVLLAVLLLARLAFGYRLWFLYLRLIVFVAVAIAVYLTDFYQSDLFLQHPYILLSFYAVVGAAVVVAVRYSQDQFFQASPLDYLVLLLVVVLVVISENDVVDISAIRIVVQLIVVFYAAEIVIKHMKSRVNIFTLSAFMSLCLVAWRGLV